MLFNNLDIHNSNNLQIAVQFSGQLLNRWRRYIIRIFIHKKLIFTVEAPAFMKKLIFSNREWLKYRYYLLSKTFWTKMHDYAAAVHGYLLRVHKSSRLKLVKDITFRLSLKVFKFCNFSFERSIYFLISAHQLNERHAFALNRCKL